MSDPAAVADGLLAERDGAVLRLTLNRPDVHNALDWRTREAVVATLQEASADLAVRAVLLTGAGDRAFCTGADLRVPIPTPPKPEGAPARPQGEVARGIATGWQRVVTAVLDCEKPVVAAVNGTAAGAGMHLALACDVVVMAETAKLVPVFVRRGIAPDAAGAYLLTRLVGPQVAKRLYLFGDDVPAADAERLGLVTEVVPAEQLRRSATELAQRLAAGPTRTLGITKRLVNRALDVDRETALSDEAWGQELVMTTEDAQEGVRAFVERRDTQFRGW
ncbi:MAG TPA: enoyl-CoA hydratase-related protein [Mycobacteriales bacterium]|nr:enoyl-CoA hydratase-related protein [Mycobacteriales bacterium]